MAPSVRKVRMACRRCRVKRIKCDGHVPACGQCSKAGEPCVDVDGRNNDLSIPRDFAVASRARIQWLEEQIRTAMPHFDLSQGPQLNFGFMTLQDRLDSSEQQEATSASTDFSTAPATASPQSSGSKRPHSAVDELGTDRPFSDEARSVAIDLGMLSLNSDSRQKHYLGSSSGLLFTRLIGAEGKQSRLELTRSSRPRATRRTTQLSPLERSEDILSIHAKLQKDLPSRDDAHHLLGIYFEDVHIDHPVIQPASLLRALDALYDFSDAARDAMVDHHGWVQGQKPFAYNGELDPNDGSTPISVSTAAFHVFMALSLAATLMTRRRNYDHSPKRLYQVAMSTAPECFSNISVPALQGVLLLTVHSLIAPANVNVWTLIHIAMAHCVDLGLHREPRDAAAMSLAALNTRRLVFYTTYSLDRSIATIQGRPLGIRDETFDAHFPSVAELNADPTNDSEDSRIPSASRLEFSLRRFKLDQCISDIKSLLYPLPTEVNPLTVPADPMSIQEKIKTDLDNWLAEIPEISPCFAPGDDLEAERLALKLELLYHGAIILLYQPSQIFRSPSTHALYLCYHSSSRRLQLYKHLSDEDNFYHSWRSVQGIFAAGATMVYSFWTLRGSGMSLSLAETLKDLRICSNLLSIGGEWWPSVKRGKESFERIVDLTIKKFGVLQDTQEPRAIRRRLTIPEATSGSNQDPSGMVDWNPSRGDSSNVEDGLLPALESGLFPQNSDFLVDDGDPGHGEDVTRGQETTEASDQALEHFLADFLQSDFSWDPFAESLDDLRTS